MTIRIPDKVSYEEATVLPLALLTASAGLYAKDQLALPYPTTHPEPTNQTVIIWGGSTSVGCAAIQLAAASGYDVLTTCSPRNFELCKRLGASKVYDYNSPTVAQDIITALKGKTVAGALTMSTPGAELCLEIVPNCRGNKIIAMAAYPNLTPPPTRFVFARIVFHFMAWTLWARWTGWRKGTKTPFVVCGDTAFSDIGAKVYNEYVPEALLQGMFVPAPEPQVVGRGLEKIQEGLDTHRKGVSARKVVVSL